MEYQNAGTTATPQQTPAVSVELQRLEKVHMEITEMVAALESRLMVAMREPDPNINPSKNQQDNVAIVSPSQLVIMLRSRVNEAENIGNRLTSILRRLDV